MLRTESSLQLFSIMTTSKRTGLLIALALITTLCGSWGFLMHRTVTQLSVYQLPSEMQPFFHQHLEYLVRNSVRPDERRNKDDEEATKHFIDLEAFGANAAADMPLEWNAAVAKYSEDTLLKYGHVPYWVVTMQERLTAAFLQGLRDSILFYAADIAHYIEDAHVPLHTTLNYDGQLTNQKGIHSLWESTVPELTIAEFKLAANKRASYLKNPSKSIWTAVRKAHKLMPAVLQTERDVTLNFTDSTKYRIQVRNGRESRSYRSAFARAYGKRLQPSINKQALSSANLVASFWYTAWVNAGRPDLTPLLTKPWGNNEQQTFAAEREAYRKNELLKKGWLLSRKGAAADTED